MPFASGRRPPDESSRRRDSSQRDWQRIAWRLVVATLVWNVAEAVVALWAGARADSLSLQGFGFDAVLECVAAAALLWRLAGGAEGEGRERTVQRVVGATFLLLAAWVGVQSVRALALRAMPDESPVGIALAALSLVVMPLVAWGKLRAARELDSRALRAEARETLACSYLSFCLLVGLVAHATLGVWWADPAAALAMVPWLVKEGLEGVRGEHDGC